MGLLRRPLSPGTVALPPLEWSRSGLYLGMDSKAHFLTDGMPECRDRWYLDAILGGQRSVKGVPVTEATAIIVGGPGGGHKSAGWMAGVIAQWGNRGPVLALSTKLDQARWTGPLRERVGKVMVLDWPGKQAASLPYQRVKWTPLDGCEDVGVTKDRMTSMMETALMAGERGDPFWEKNAVAVVSAYAHAAALKGAGVEQVMSWLDRDELSEPQRAIKAHGSHARLGTRLATLGGKAEETREGILHMARLVFEACEDPAVLDGCTPDMFDAFDIDKFLDSSDTLYLLDKGGKATISTLAPLTVGFVNAVLERAEAKADATLAGPGQLDGRLAKPLLVLIDEAYAISPLPNLVQVLSQARGRGIVVCVAVQSYSQLTERWGDAGARSLMDTAAYRLVAAGLQDMDFLTDISKAAGESERWRPTLGSQAGGGGNSRKGKSESHTLVETPTYKASTLGQLPEGTALLLGREGVRLVKLPALPSLLDALERAEEAADAEAVATAPGGWNDPRRRPSWRTRLRWALSAREEGP